MKSLRILILIIILVIAQIIVLAKNPKIVKLIINVFKNTFYDKDKIINKEAVQEESTYDRHLSFADDLYYVYWLAFKHNIIRNKTNIISAMLLKLNQEDKIKILKKGNANFISKGNFTIELINNARDLDDVEERLYELLKKASADMLLSEEEFFEFMKTNGDEVTQFINYLLDSETNKLLDNNLIIKKNNHLIETSRVKNDVKELIRFKNFLENFTNFEDKTAKESKLWDEYIIISQLLGINNKINEELKLLYPWLLYDINLQEEGYYDN